MNGPAILKAVIEDNHGNQRVLFQAINSLFHKKAELQYPSACSDANLADLLNSFFDNRILLIQDYCSLLLMQLIQLFHLHCVNVN